MTNSPYDYSTRIGIHLVSWNDFHGLTKALALAIAPWEPEIILPVGRGGYYPGSLLAHMLQVEIYPVRLSRRVNDKVTYDSPQWLVEPPSAVAGRRVLIVDEISSTGETLLTVRERVIVLGAQEVRAAVLYAHTWGSNLPDYIGLLSDELIMNPWDREILRDGTFQFHPEYVDALRQLGVTPETSFLIPATPFVAAKGG